MSEPGDMELLEEKLAKLEPFERWKVQVSGYTEVYAKAASITRERVGPVRGKLTELESSFSRTIEEGKAEKLLELYEKILRLSLHSTVRFDEQILRPRRQHRKLKAELEQMFTSGKISGEQFKEEVGNLSKFKQVALDFEDVMEDFNETSRYLGAIASELLSRLRYIREAENQRQLGALNESLKGMTKKLLIYTFVIAIFTVLTFVIAFFRT